MKLPSLRKSQPDKVVLEAVTMMSIPVTDKQIRDAITELLKSRQPPATICPSEAARALATDEWRPLMPQVRAVAIAMAKIGVLDIRQGGKSVRLDKPIRGPIRLGGTTHSDHYPKSDFGPAADCGE